MKVTINFDINLEKYTSPSSEISRILLDSKYVVTALRVMLETSKKTNVTAPILDSNQNNIGNINVSL